MGKFLIRLVKAMLFSLGFTIGAFILTILLIKAFDYFGPLLGVVLGAFVTVTTIAYSRLD